MMKQRILILCALFLGSISLLAQVKTPDPKTKKTNKIGINTDRLEFGYKEVTGTTTSTSSGRMGTYSYLIQLPYVKINDNPPTEIHFGDNTTSSLFKNCPAAHNEFKLAKTYRKKAILTPLIIFGAGGLIGLTGFVTSIDKNKPGLLLPSLGVGLGAMITGVLVSRKYAIKSKNYLEGSFATYNSSCYKPIEKEEPKSKDKKIDKKKENTTSNTSTAAKPTTTEKKIDKPSVTPTKFEEVYTYKTIRNNPADGGFWNIAFFFADAEGGGTRGASIRSNFSIAYYKGVQYGLKATFGKTYLDNFEGYDGSPFGTSGIYNRKAWVTNYKKQTNIDLVAYKKIASKSETIEKHSVELGRTIMHGHAVDHSSAIKLDIEKSWLARGGFSQFRGLVDGYAPNSSLTLVSSNNGQLTTLDNQSAAMMRAASVVLGAGYRSTSDYKIKILEGELKGDKEDTSYGEIYADVLYSPIVKYDPILYGFEKNVVLTDINTHSPKSKLNFRVGYESVILNKKWGVTYNVEVGSRPGTVDYKFYGKIRMGFLFGGRI